jgi:hypothetical protein
VTSNVGGMNHIMLRSFIILSLLHVNASVTGSPSIVISDDFSDNTLNAGLWDIRFTGSGELSVAEQNGRVEFGIGANTSGNNEVGISYLQSSAKRDGMESSQRLRTRHW